MALWACQLILLIQWGGRVLQFCHSTCLIESLFYLSQLLTGWGARVSQWLLCIKHKLDWLERVRVTDIKWAEQKCLGLFPALMIICHSIGGARYHKWIASRSKMVVTLGLNISWLPKWGSGSHQQSIHVLFLCLAAKLFKKVCHLPLCKQSKRGRGPQNFTFTYWCHNYMTKITLLWIYKMGFMHSSIFSLLKIKTAIF